MKARLLITLLVVLMLGLLCWERVPVHANPGSSNWPSGSLRNLPAPKPLFESGQKKQCTIKVSASPADAGTVEGGGTFGCGEVRTISATANNGYTFSKWTERNREVNQSRSYTFTPNQNRDLVAVFEPVSAGEILSIGCESHRKSADDPNPDCAKAESLKAKQKIYAKQCFCCNGPGTLKMLVYQQAVDVTSAMGWYPIPEVNNGNNSGSEGKPHEQFEQLNWFSGTYKRDPSAGDDPNKSVAAYLATLPPAERGYYLTGNLGMTVPEYFAVGPQNADLFVTYPNNQNFLMKSNGRRYTYGNQNGLNVQATPKDGALILSVMEDKFRSDVTIQPSNNGDRLIVNRKIFFGANSKPIESTLIYNRISKQILLPSRGGESAAGPVDNPETITAELQQTIALREIDPTASFSLKVTEPKRLVGATIGLLVTKRRAIPSPGKQIEAGKDFELIFTLENFHLPDGRLEQVVGVVESITWFAETLPLREIASEPPVSHYFLSRDAILPKGSTFKIHASVGKY